LSILDTAEPIAYAAPGDPGCVVVSKGLLDVLAPRERQVVLAHERAHLHHNHHRYLLAAELAVAVVPVLRPLVVQIRFATERSADESAVAALGGDRELASPIPVRRERPGQERW
jgi:Zn-dependent protease with chaperone function